MKNLIFEEVKTILENITELEFDDQIEVINMIREELHKYSPFKSEPVDFVKWVKVDNVTANDYNPNSVAPPEMELLRHSINHDGYTQPVVTWLSDVKNKIEVIDGFHRTRVCKELEDVNKRVYGYLPIVTIKDDNTGKNDRIASTVRHNRARGKHSVESMSDISIDLKKRKWTDERIAKELGMDKDEILKLHQVNGLIENFENVHYSKSWDVDSFDEDLYE